MGGRRSVAYRLLGVALFVAVVSSSCTYVVARPGVTVGCAALEVELNPHGELDAARRQAIIGAVEEFGALVGRDVEYLGRTTARAVDHQIGDPLLIEVAWPQEAPSAWGFAAPAVSGGRYVEGWMYVNPVLAAAPTGVIRRLVLHELGHLYGLDHVDDTGELMNPDLTVTDYGPGDLVGLIVTHDGGCAGNTLVAALAEAV